MKNQKVSYLLFDKLDSRNFSSCRKGINPNFQITFFRSSAQSLFYLSYFQRSSIFKGADLKKKKKKTLKIIQTISLKYIPRKICEWNYTYIL